MRRWLIMCVLGFLLFIQACQAVQDAEELIETEKPVSVKSYLGNYVVIAPDSETASLYAKLAEDTRKNAANILSDDREYEVLTYMTIQPSETGTDAAKEWKITALHGISKRDFGTISKSRLDGMVKFCVVYYYILDIAASEAAANNAIVRENQIPLWICAAILENLTAESKEAYRSFIFETINEGKHMPFERLFLHSGEFKSEKERALYFHECGSLFDYLASLSAGRKEVLEAIRGLAKYGDLAISLMWQYKNEFSSVASLELKWIEYVKKRPEKFFDFKRLNVEETRKRISQILIVEITYLDNKTIQEKTEQTDFEGLMKHKDKAIRINIAMKKMAQMQDIKLRAPVEYQDTIGEYILSLKAIIEGEKRQFKMHYDKANRMFNKL